ncbi:MAG TPA: histidinol dehydrogenase [Candidatus Thermoplasmatota archaeon]|nr:histidinol dehydrogenase [Candidatus Thermoplasmatota archaeon]
MPVPPLPGLRFTGALAALSPEQRRALLERGRAGLAEARRAVEPLVEQVRARGDDALRELTLRFDGARLERIEVSDRERQALARMARPDDRKALARAAKRIRAYHARQKPKPFKVKVEGIDLGWQPVPLDRVGVYVPGGQASYPSTLLMGVLPAKLAGVADVVVCTPPRRDGSIHPLLAAAAEEAGADRLFRVGGAQAIFALAWGTATIPAVDKIVGPGNVYVQAAKQLVHGQVGVDMLAGPSEVLVIADDTAPPRLVALEMAAQSEHDPGAASVVVALSQTLTKQVEAELAALLPSMARHATIERALAANGALLTAGSLEEALAFANAHAPEHLVLMVKNPRAALAKVKRAGSVFLGPLSPVAMGDYGAGTNHILPTAGSARFSSGLSVLDFVTWVQWQQASQAGAGRVAPDVARLAHAEGLQAHAAAAEARLDLARATRKR